MSEKILDIAYANRHANQEIMNGKPGTLHKAGPSLFRVNLYSQLLDTMKGSFYANPVLDEPNVSDELRKGYPEYYGKNICMDTHSTAVEPGVDWSCGRAHRHSRGKGV